MNEETYLEPVKEFSHKSIVFGTYLMGIMILTIIQCLIIVNISFERLSHLWQVCNFLFSIFQIAVPET